MKAAPTVGCPFGTDYIGSGRFGHAPAGDFSVVAGESMSLSAYARSLGHLGERQRAELFDQEAFKD